MVIIPIDTRQSSHTLMSVNLGEFTCRFRLLWNGRDSRWYCDFQSSNGSNEGVRLVEDSPLLGDKNRLGYDGDFRVLKAVQTAEDHITYENLGKDYNLVFGTSSEWEEYDGLRTGV